LGSIVLTDGDDRVAPASDGATEERAAEAEIAPGERFADVPDDRKAERARGKRGDGEGGGVEMDERNF
jgi:hypothetical protein